MREQLPSSVEEGKAETAAEAGVVLFNKINRLINTTPALRATPPHLRRGVCLRQQPLKPATTPHRYSSLRFSN
jgi:hypothetical protein